MKRVSITCAVRGRNVVRDVQHTFDRHSLINNIRLTPVPLGPVPDNVVPISSAAVRGELPRGAKITSCTIAGVPQPPDALRTRRIRVAPGQVIAVGVAAFAPGSVRVTWDVEPITETLVRA